LGEAFDAQEPEDHVDLDRGEREEGAVDRQTGSRLDGGDDAADERDVREKQGFDEEDDPCVAPHEREADQDARQQDHARLVHVHHDHDGEEPRHVAGWRVQRGVEQIAAEKHAGGAEQVTRVVVDDEAEPAVARDERRRERTRRGGGHTGLLGWRFPSEGVFFAGDRSGCPDEL
jgi:hypothetical protein